MTRYIGLLLVIFVQQSISEDQTNHNRATEEVCYPQTGCLSQNSPWISALRPFPAPHPPEKINVGVYLLTRSSRNQAIENLKVDTSSPTAARLSLWYHNYRSARSATVFIIHGFATGVNASWIKEMGDAYLSKIDANVFLIDWRGGATLSNYLQVASNTRVAGILLANFVKFLIRSMNLRPNNIHMIGHSLGAHIAGYVGKRVNNIYRITALDAAQPGFEGSDAEVRLNSTDARNVDVHHTNGKPTFPLFGLGYITPLGDVDYYYNGGLQQPGCIAEINLDDYSLTNVRDVMSLPVEIIANLLSCSHSMSIDYFTEALRRRDCVMWGTRESFVTGTLNILTLGRIQSLLDSFCTLESCSPVGLDTFVYPGRGKFHVTTSAKMPYCSLKFMKKFQLEVVLTPPETQQQKCKVWSAIKKPLQGLQDTFEYVLGRIF